MDVDLTDYAVLLYYNNNTTANSTFNLTGTLADGQTLVIANSSANIYSGIVEISGVTGFNGNDALELTKNGTAIDVIGTVGSGSYFGKDKTLVRNSNICSPTSSYDTSEWTESSQDDVSSLGSHTANCSTVLPVNFASFTVENEGDYRVLAWETASEVNNDRFEVQRAIDGGDFVTIGEVAGNGTTTATSTYSYEDNDNVTGVLAYRLEQIDFDGATQFSSVVTVEVSANEEVSVFPNPVRRSETLNIKGGVDFMVFDTFGRMIDNVKTNNDYQLNIANYEAGYYFIKFANGKVIKFTVL